MQAKGGERRALHLLLGGARRAVGARLQGQRLKGGQIQAPHNPPLRPPRRTPCRTASQVRRPKFRAGTSARSPARARDTRPLSRHLLPDPRLYLLFARGNGARTPETLTQSLSPPRRTSRTPREAQLRGGGGGGERRREGAQPGVAAAAAAAAIPRLV